MTNIFPSSYRTSDKILNTAFAINMGWLRYLGVLTIINIGANLTGVNFSKANLRGADFSNGIISETDFTDAHLTHTIFLS